MLIHEHGNANDAFEFQNILLFSCIHTVIWESTIGTFTVTVLLSVLVTFEHSNTAKQVFCGMAEIVKHRGFQVFLSKEEATFKNATNWCRDYESRFLLCKVTKA